MSMRHIVLILKDGTRVEKCNYKKRCCVCGHLRKLFFNGLNVCVRCYHLVPNYIPEKQIEKYLEIKKDG